MSLHRAIYINEITVARQNKPLSGRQDRVNGHVPLVIFFKIAFHGVLKGHDLQNICAKAQMKIKPLKKELQVLKSLTPL